MDMSHAKESPMLRFTIPGMTCGGCAASVRKALGAVEGVESVAIDLPSRSVEVAGRPVPAAIARALAAAGFEPQGLSAA